MQIKDRIKELRRVKASDLIPNPKNWRTHPIEQQRAVQGVLAEVGYADALIAYETTAGLMLIDGHLRANATPDEAVPVLVLDVNEQEADMILTTLDPLAGMAERDDDALTSLLENLSVENDDVSELLAQMQYDMTIGTLQDAKKALKNQQKHDMSKRTLPIDFYITGLANPYCCIAVTSGLRYGRRSTDGDGRLNPPRPCTWPKPFFGGRHLMGFIDNDFHNYDHEAHAGYVKEHRPKYATVMDAMTVSQCREAGIKHYSLPQIIEMGDELLGYAENVIVIPKYDCIDEIPDRFMVGYSIPTSYGGTPLPIEAFRGRRIHLLGGGWKAQRNAMLIMGDDVVSGDNNQIHLLAKIGAFHTPDGGTDGSLKDFNLRVTNPGMIAFTISCGTLASDIKVILGGAVPDEQESENLGEGSEREER